MHVILIYIQVKPQDIESFKEATIEYAKECQKEPGNIRFDALHSKVNQSYFVLYEAYESAEDAAAHKGAAHYLHWKDTVANWMASPRQSAVYEGLQPSNDFWVSDK